jgi:hypothetical protein
MPPAGADNGVLFRLFALWGCRICLHGFAEVAFGKEFLVQSARAYAHARVSACAKNVVQLVQNR